MNYKHIAAFAAFLLLASCCPTPQHRQARADLDARIQLLNSDELFVDLNRRMPRRERECMEFLYAYMPLCDLADYPADFFRANVRLSLEARREMPWGKAVPDREFRHFVLPVRVNNENLDGAREVFYNELKDRVRDLTMEQAVLEVNHWCHEKVEYHPSDSRTSSPLATVKTAFGRCGEESTLLVAALRSVCIPARQVYTPRWAHCDDNHAWVEAYVDGRWRFLGACEPEPVLDLGWFNAPASRVLMVHTKAFGRYDGPEEILDVTPNYTEINVTANYAEVGDVNVKVIDNKGDIVPNAKVRFCIYNYAEFYPFACKQTDSSGCASLSCGRGDLLVWATDGTLFDFAEVKLSQMATVDCVLRLDKDSNCCETLSLDVVPPAEKAVFPEVSAEQRMSNNHRLAYEDSLRNAYVSTFKTDAEGVCHPELGDDCEAVSELLKASRGNWQTITDFLSTDNASMRQILVQLLQTLTEKDLRDIGLDVLNDHADNSYMGGWLNNQFEYTWNPRVANEMLKPYKKFFQNQFAEYESVFASDPLRLVQWCSDSITIFNEQNYLHVPMAPTGVYRARVADDYSRDIFFVAVARSLGIAARIEPSTQKVQYCDRQNVWHDVQFGANRSETARKGTVVAGYKPVVGVDDPLYYKHFTISRFSDGCYRMMPFDVGAPGFEEGDTWSHLLRDGLLLDEGSYLLTTGVRSADGSVACMLDFFTLKGGDTVNIGLRLAAERKPLDVLGMVDTSLMFIDLACGELLPLSRSIGSGPSVLALVEPGTEPVNHVLRDISALKNQFERWNGTMLLLFADEDSYIAYQDGIGELDELPSNISYGIADRKLWNDIGNSLDLNGQMPVLMLLHDGNKVGFMSQGYMVGAGEQLFKLIDMSSGE